MALEVGTVIDGKYEIVGVLGQGGMGTVYEGRHQIIHRQVAIKVLKASVAEDEEIVRRFAREAQAAARIGSSHIVEVYDVGELPNGEHYQILEYLDGESLSQRLKRVRTMAPAEIFPLALQLLVGLSAAHQAGIVHRDLKPGNIYLARTKDGGGEVVKILDFGISKFHYVDGDDATKTGAIVGTPHYMAPEQTRDASKADHRSDLYAVGAVLYRALAGRTPFVAKTIHELIAQLIVHDPQSLGDVVPELDPQVVAIVHKALAREPIDRYQNARELAAALSAWLDGAGVPLPAMSGSGASWPQPSLPAATPPRDSWPSGSQMDAGVPAEAPTTPLQLTPVSYPGAPPSGSGSATPVSFTGGPVSGPSGQAQHLEAPPPPQNASRAAATSSSPGMGAPTPPSLATPAPAFFDPADVPDRSRKSIGVAVAGAAAVVVGVAVAAVVLLSGGEPTTSPAEPLPVGAAADPADDPGLTEPRPEPVTEQSGPEASGAPTASVAPDGSASAAAATPRRPPATPKTTTPPRPRPPKPPKPPKDERDFRTDL